MNKTRSLTVDLGARAYPIAIGPGVMDDLSAIVPFPLKNRSVFILTDDHVRSPHGERLQGLLRDSGARSVEMLSLPPGEQTKSLERLEHVLSWMLDHHVDRKSVLFALGGGVVGDLGGFAASIVMRGIPFVQAPTTLLAQVDSSVGGKTGINMPHGKNLVGAFYQPRAVLCDLELLRTLPRREILAGYAEVAKYGLLGDAEFFIWLETHARKVCALENESLARAIETSCRKKAEIVAADEREQDSRALLNLGHTFGHALEAAARYDGRLLHGEAVAIGIVLAFRLSVRRGHCPPEDANRVERHFREIGLPTSIAQIRPAIDYSAAELLSLMEHDKKAESGNIVFILTHGIGKAWVSRDVDPADVLSVLERSLEEGR